MYRARGARGKCRRAGASHGTCTGTYFNQHRPLTTAPADHFGGTYLYHFVICIYVSRWRDEGQVPARRRQQRDMHRHVFQSTSTANYCTGRTFWRYIFVSFCDKYIRIVIEGRGQMPAPWRRQQDIHRHAFQPTSTANECTGIAFLRYKYVVSSCGTCASLWTH